MSAPATSNATPALSWEKLEKPLKGTRKKQNPLMVVAVVAIVVLSLVGLWRATHQTASTQWVSVVAAGKDIPPGTRLSFTALRYVQFPKKFLARDMATSLSDVEGNVTRTFIAAGEPIRPAMVFPARKNLSRVLETHERAISLQLPDDALVDHQIDPDDRVDVLVVSTKDGDKFTKTICQDARVLLSAPKDETVARRGGSSNLNKITLAVTPDVAEALTEAAEVGKIRLVLRNSLGRTRQHLSGVDQDDLLPPSAFQHSAAALMPTSPAAATTLSAVPPLPPPPVLGDSVVKAVAAMPQGPIEWIVDMFNGNKKESVSVPSM